MLPLRYVRYEPVRLRCSGPRLQSKYRSGS